MDRRAALRNIGLSAGFIAVTPTLISLMQSCSKKEYMMDWTPELLTADEAKALDQIVDLIIPETDIPGAKALHVPMLIDKYATHVASAEEAGMFKTGAGMILVELGVNEDKPVDEVTTEAYDALLAKYLKLPKEKQMEYRNQMYAPEALENPESIPQEVIVFNFLASIRDLTILGYKSTEYIGENVLAYQPVPGEQIGCAPVNTLTGGKAWSL